MSYDEIYYWLTDREWWDTSAPVLCIREDAPDAAKESYKKYTEYLEHKRPLRPKCDQYDPPLPERIPHPAAIIREARLQLLLYYRDCAIANSRPTVLHDEELLEIAKDLVRRIREGSHLEEEWLELEKEVNSFFENTPKELFHTIDDLFLESGAGEMLSMICSAIRYKEDEGKNEHRLLREN